MSAKLIMREWAYFDVAPNDEWHRSLEYPSTVREAKSRHKGDRGNPMRRYRNLWWRSVYAEEDE